MPPSSASRTSAIWLMLVGAIFLLTINGPNSDFPVYSSQLKGMSQMQLNFLALASDTGKLFGWLPGVAAQHCPLWLVAFIGATFDLVGYGVQYLFLDTARFGFWHMFFLTAIAGNGITWTNTACQLLFVSDVVVGSRSPVAVILVTSYQGLSGKVYTSLAEAMPGLASSKTKTYLLLNAVVPMLVTVVVAPFLRVVDLKSDSTTDTAFLFIFAMALITFVLGIIGSTSSVLSGRNRMISLMVPLATLFLIPAALNMQEISPAKRENSTVPDEVGRADVVIDITGDTKEKDTVAVPMNGYIMSRTAAMTSLMPPMAVAYFLLLISTSDGVLYTSTAIIATCTGAISSVAVRATSELFGAKNFGVNHNLLVANIPVGNLCFGSLAAFLYQRAAAAAAGEHGHACSGAGCYRVSFAVWGAASLVGTLLCTVLHMRTSVKVHEMPADAETGIEMGRNLTRRELNESMM